mmetsp:Transcript_100628/g.305372  ORF Transcript_100628/g.305372 Transcript_100628/m.305372 type:complete len:96 (+) Transcript_100628:312-599(+)
MLPRRLLSMFCFNSKLDRWPQLELDTTLCRSWSSCPPELHGEAIMVSDTSLCLSQRGRLPWAASQAAGGRAAGPWTGRGGGHGTGLATGPCGPRP